MLKRFYFATLIFALLATATFTAGATEEPVCAPGCIKTPAKLTCEQLLSKAEQRHCFPQTATATPPVVVPCAGAPCPAPQVTVNCPECKPTVTEKLVPFPVDAPPPPAKFRMAFGGDLGWNEEHTALFGLHAGFLAPTDRNGGNLFWKIGPTYQEHPDFTTTCMIGCRSCGAQHEGAGPWGALTSLSYIWK